MKRIRVQFKEYCSQLGVDCSLHTTPQHDGSPHVEQIGECHHYVVTERGNEYERRITNEEDELLYWLMSDVIHRLASDYELEHRVPGKDSRRQLFEREIYLFETLKSDWARRRSAEIEQTLKDHPFSDEG